MNVQVETVVVGAFQVNCYVVWGEDKKAALIDPGADADIIRQVLAERDLVLASYFLTHGHIDHISALGTLLGEHPAPVALHPEDSKWAFSAANTMPPFYREMVAPPARGVMSVEDAATIDIVGEPARVIHTPGHTPGSVCLYLPDAGLLFSGDTLFAGSVGRTDLPGGDSRALRDSLRKIPQLPPETVIYPGHGPQTTVSQELATNFFLRG